ncbi:HD domain-containing protein [Streptomyces sp. NPDC047990]|uniref:HD domain-containing protein n=1 Tax=Streptomyces sp. NPDC047990 TaxID=3365496 RepID=UPI0037106BFC
MSSALDTPQGAAELAESLLPPLGNRWLHTQAVAARAREVSAVVPEEERDLLVAAAWLHDLGYAPLRVYAHLMPTSQERTRRAIDDAIRS